MPENPLEKQIRQEIAQKVAQFTEMGMPEEQREAMYFNNFHLKLPYGEKRKLLAAYLDDPRMACQNGKTLRQFFQDVDTAVQEAGIDSQVKKLQPESKHLDTRRKLFDLAFPVYVRLRGMGYTHKDLAS
jgi:hypothetical protein